MRSSRSSFIIRTGDGNVVENGDEIEVSEEKNLRRLGDEWIFKIWELSEKLLKDKSVNLTEGRIRNCVFKSNTLCYGITFEPYLFRVVGLAWNCKLGLYGDGDFESNDPCHVVSVVGGNTLDLRSGRIYFEN